MDANTRKIVEEADKALSAAKWCIDGLKVFGNDNIHKHDVPLVLEHIAIVRRNLDALLAAPDDAGEAVAIGRYAVDPVRANESVALAEKIMDRVISTGSAYLKLELVDPSSPQPAAAPQEGQGK
jgi:hypothetical protein